MGGQKNKIVSKLVEDRPQVWIPSYIKKPECNGHLLAFVFYSANNTHNKIDFLS